MLRPLEPNSPLREKERIAGAESLGIQDPKEEVDIRICLRTRTVLVRVLHPPGMDYSMNPTIEKLKQLLILLYLGVPLCNYSGAGVVKTSIGCMRPEIRDRESENSSDSLTWRFMSSYSWNYKSPNIGYNYTYPTYNPTYNYPQEEANDFLSGSGLHIIRY